MRQGPTWQGTSYGHYRPAGAPATAAQRILDQVPALPPGGAFGGWVAAFVHGVDWLDGLDVGGRPLPVPVYAGVQVHRRSTSELRYARHRLDFSEVVSRHGLRVTSALRTAFDVARWAPSTTEAVVALDAVASFGLVPLADLGHYVAEMARAGGVPRVREALRRADAGVRSPWESRLRMVYVLEAGLPRPLVNRTVYDDRGRFVAIPDLLDVEAGLVLEYDGSGHREREQHNADNAREEALESVGLIVVRADSLDYRHRRAPLVARLRDGRRRGMARNRGKDRWTLTPPAWALDPYESLTDEDKEALFGCR